MTIETSIYVKATDEDVFKLRLHRDDNVPYIAKKLWEQLYLMADAWRWDSLYCLLCDLNAFETFIERGVVDQQETICYWTTDPGVGGWTGFSHYYPFVIEGDIYKITFDPCDQAEGMYESPTLLIERTTKP